MVKVVIKRNEDRNYDRLFHQVEQATILGRAESASEGQGPDGYEVTFKHLDADVLAWLSARPRDFAVS